MLVHCWVVASLRVAGSDRHAVSLVAQTDTLEESFVVCVAINNRATMYGMLVDLFRNLANKLRCLAFLLLCIGVYGSFLHGFQPGERTEIVAKEVAEHRPVASCCNSWNQIPPQPYLSGTMLCVHCLSDEI